MSSSSQWRVLLILTIQQYCIADVGLLFVYSRWDSKPDAITRSTKQPTLAKMPFSPVANKQFSERRKKCAMAVSKLCSCAVHTSLITVTRHITTREAQALHLGKFSTGSNGKAPEASELFSSKHNDSWDQFLNGMLLCQQDKKARLCHTEK